jgi:hypothetical protein
MSDDTRDQSSERGRPAPTLARSRQVPLDLVDVAAEIQRSDGTLATMTTGKLQLIAEQIRKLQEQARGVLERARVDASLHRVDCGFRKRPGHVYHLYRKPDASLYFSMLSPEDWNGAPPDSFAGSFRLEPDMGWTPLGEIEQRDAQEGALRKLLQAGGEEG